MDVVFKELLTAGEFETVIPLLRELEDFEDLLDVKEMIVSFLEAIKHDYHHFGVYYGDDLIGTFGISLRYNPTYSGVGCELSSLIIKQEFRSRGFGEKSMEYALKWAQNYASTFVRLFVYPDNKQAVKFYKRLGYKHTSNFFYKEIDS